MIFELASCGVVDRFDASLTEPELGLTQKPRQAFVLACDVLGHRFRFGLLAVIIGAKIGVALVVSQSRAFLRGATYVWSMRLIGGLMPVFAVMIVERLPGFACGLPLNAGAHASASAVVGSMVEEGHSRKAIRLLARSKTTFR